MSFKSSLDGRRRFEDDSDPRGISKDPCGTEDLSTSPKTRNETKRNPGRRWSRGPSPDLSGLNK